MIATSLTERNENTGVGDTGPLYAAADPSDLHHRRAISELEKLARNQREVVVLFPILLEAYSLVQRRFDANVAVRWLTEIEGDFDQSCAGGLSPSSCQGSRIRRPEDHTFRRDTGCFSNANAPSRVDLQPSFRRDANSGLAVIPNVPVLFPRSRTSKTSTLARRRDRGSGVSAC